MLPLVLTKGRLSTFLALCLALPLTGSTLDSLRQQASAPANPSQQMAAWIALGDYYQMRNHNSVYYFVEALRAYGEKERQPLATIQAHKIMGRVYHNRGEIDAAKASYHRAIAQARQGKLPAELGGLYLNLGLSHSRGFYLDSAIYYVQLAEQYFVNYQQSRELWRCYSAAATIQIERANFTQADQDFRKSIELLPADAAAADRGFLIYRAFAYALKHQRFELLGEARIKWDEYKGSQRFSYATLERPQHLSLYQMVAGEDIAIEQAILAALTYYEQFDNNFLRAWCYEDLGSIYLERNQFNQAISAFERANELYTLAGVSVHLGYIRKQLAQLHQRAGNWAAALYYTEASYQILDSLRNRTAEENLQRFQVEYETAKKEQALKIQDLELHQKTQQRNIFIGSSLLLALLAGTIFGSFRLRLRQSRLLSEQAAAFQEQRIQELEKDQRLLALSAMIEGQEQERMRIAKDLHDGMGCSQPLKRILARS